MNNKSKVSEEQMLVIVEFMENVISSPTRTRNIEGLLRTYILSYTGQNILYVKMNGPLLKQISPLINIIRNKGFRAPGGIKYPGGITYYPRTKNHQDPEYTPTKLFRVERIKPLKYNPGWQKKILINLHIGENQKVTIVKNIPEINARLWKVKHLIKVTPIVFPYGEPTRDDINYTILKENGECIVNKKLEVNVKHIEALDQFHANTKKMDSTTIKKDSRKKWNEPFSGGF